jgi:hypothetical protein
MLVCNSHNSVYHIPTFLPYKHRVMTTTYQHFSLTNTELWLPHTNISPLETQSYDYHIPTFLPNKHRAMTTHTNISALQIQSYDYHIPTFLPYKHRAMTTTYQHFSLTNTDLWLPHTNISPFQTHSYDYHMLQLCVCKGEMLVCGSHNSVFVREKCWYVVVIVLCLQGRNVGMW